MCRNSSNTHNVLNNTAKEQVSELTNTKEAEEEVSVPANLSKEGKANTETSRDSHGPYTESFELNQETFV